MTTIVGRPLTGATLTRYETLDELVQAIPIYPTQPDSGRRVVYSVDLGTPLGPDELLEVSTAIEATTPSTSTPGFPQVLYNVAFVTLVTVARDPADVTFGPEPLWPGPDRIVQPLGAAGENITSSIHHSYRSLSGSIQMPSDLDPAAAYQFVNLVAYAQSTAAPADGSHRLKVEPGVGGNAAYGYGGLTVIRNTPAAL